MELYRLSKFFIAVSKSFPVSIVQTNHAPEAVVEGASRAMRISMNRELENLETHIPFLGTVGSISRCQYFWYRGGACAPYRAGRGEAGDVADGCTGYR